MSHLDKTRVIVGVRAVEPNTLHLAWSDGVEVDIDLRSIIADRAFATLGDAVEFARVEIGDWGHSLVWPSGPELGADALWLETLSATGHDDVRAFLEWRLHHSLSLNGAADALGISRRMVAHYSNGERKVPKSILLACRGWELEIGRAQAA